jgi:hypothetical protein
MTTITTTDRYYSNPYRLREQSAESAAAAALPTLATSPSFNAEAPTVSSGGSSASASLSAALWQIDSGTPVRTTMSGKVEDTSSSDELVAELHKWANMTPAEMIRAKVLERMGLTEESLDAMPADERKIIEDEIAAEVKRSLGINEDGTDAAPAAPGQDDAA